MVQWIGLSTEDRKNDNKLYLISDGPERMACLALACLPVGRMDWTGLTDQ